MTKKRNPRSAQIIVTTSFLTVLIMLTIAFVAYSAAIFNTKPFFDDYAAISLNFRSSSEALTRHLLANLTAWAKSQGDALTLSAIRNYVNTKIVPLINSFTVTFRDTNFGKALSITVVPASTYANPSTALYNGTAINWPGFYPSSLTAVGYSLASYRYFLDISSDSFYGYTFSSTALLLVNVTSTSKPDAKTINLELQSKNEADFEVNLLLLSASVHRQSGGWSSVGPLNSTLFNYVNGNYTLSIEEANSQSVDQVSFCVFDPRSLIVCMISAV